MSESNEGTPSHRPRVARFAERLFALLNEHPVLKLLAVLWVIGTSLWVPLDTWRRERAEARRAGWQYVPSVRLQLGASGHCQLTNTGNRAIAEATLEWKEYYIDGTECRPPLTLFETKPAAETHELLARGELEIVYADDRRQRTCHNISVTPGACGVGHDCHLVVECEALYHRAADLQPYQQSQFLLLEDSCTSFVPFKTLVVLRKGQVEWKHQRYRDVWRCLSLQRARQKAPVQQLDDFNAMLDQLLERER